MFHFSISSNTSNSKNINASNRNKMFSDYRSETFRLCRTEDKKYNFSSSKIFKVLMDCPDAQRETFPKSYNSSGNRKNLPTQFLSQRRYFMGNLKNIDRFLPSVKEVWVYMFQRKLIFWHIYVYVCIFQNAAVIRCNCTVHHILKRYVRCRLWVKFGFSPRKNLNQVKS